VILIHVLRHCWSWNRWSEKLKCKVTCSQTVPRRKDFFRRNHKTLHL